MNAISHTIRLSCGFSRSSPPEPLISLEVTRDEMRALVIWNEAQADQARAERRDHLAEKLDARASSLKEAAR